MKNKLIDLNNHLFAQMERLSDEGLTADKERMHLEIQRTRAMSEIGSTIVKNAQLALEARRLRTEGDIDQSPLMIESDDAGE